MSAADALWCLGGAPDEPSAERDTHRLSLALLRLAHETAKVLQPPSHSEQQRRGLACAPEQAPCAAGPGAEDERERARLPRELHLAPDGAGFRQVRPNFLTAAECELLRSAMTVSLINTLRRGGQSTLAVVPELRERMLAAGSTPKSYNLLHDILLRVRAAAIADAADAAVLRAAPACPVCGMKRRSVNDATATQHGLSGRAMHERDDAVDAAAAGGAGVADSATDSAADGAAGAGARSQAAAGADRAACCTLHVCGALLVRLLPPESADRLAPACWALPAPAAYWEPHVDQHNVSAYDVSAVLYLSTAGGATRRPQPHGSRPFPSLRRPRWCAPHTLGRPPPAGLPSSLLPFISPSPTLAASRLAPPHPSRTRRRSLTPHSTPRHRARARQASSREATSASTTPMETFASPRRRARCSRSALERRTLTRPAACCRARAVPWRCGSRAIRRGRRRCRRRCHRRSYPRWARNCP